jgi:hypothetical protein
MSKSTSYSEFGVQKYIVKFGVHTKQCSSLYSLYIAKSMVRIPENWKQGHQNILSKKELVQTRLTCIGNFGIMPKW